MIRGFIAGDAPIIRNPYAVRPWQHVLECVEGYILLAERLLTSGEDASEAWNFGPNSGAGLPVSFIADRVSQLWGGNMSWQLAPDNGKPRHEAMLLNLDSSKARLRLGWKTRLTLDDALEWTVNWYRSFAANSDMRAASLNQIDQYSRRASI
jgi:CDP-glucose 4,6-dehydratase